jgi:hypothetical protein
VGPLGDGRGLASTATRLRALRGALPARDALALRGEGPPPPLLLARRAKVGRCSRRRLARALPPPVLLPPGDCVEESPTAGPELALRARAWWEVVDRGGLGDARGLGCCPWPPEGVPDCRADAWNCWA